VWPLRSSVSKWCNDAFGKDHSLHAMSYFMTQAQAMGWLWHVRHWTRAVCAQTGSPTREDQEIPPSIRRHYPGPPQDSLSSHGMQNAHNK
jgi:hypothetical protein